LPPADVASRISSREGLADESRRSDDGVSSNGSRQRVCGPRSCAGDELIRNGHGQLTVRFSRDGQAVSA
jgi:hypothetical protein